MLDKKTDILLAARKLFSEKDFTSVSMQAIAEECKMSKASLIVWAINEGREVAREVDRYLMGSSVLP